MSTGRVILKNLFSLSIAEIANKGILFISTAYLARVILPEGFGVISFANSFLVFFSILVNLGFSIVGSREIAKDLNKIKKYANQITSVRLILAVVSSLLLILIAGFIDKPLTVKIVIIISGVNLYSQAFLMDWVYQGNERMEFPALRQLITSLLSLIGLVIFVHTQNDVIMAMIITVASAFINSVWMLMLYLKMYGKITFGFDKEFIRELLKSSLPITFSNFFITIYNFMNILMLGFMKSDAETGIYTAAFKFVALVITPSAIIQNAFFPLLSRTENPEDRHRIFRIYGNLMFIIGSILSLLVLTFSGFFIQTAYGSKYIPSIPVLNILMITVLLMFMNTIFYPALVSWKKEKIVMYAIATGGIINIILNIILIPAYGAMGAAWSTVFSELGVLVGLVFITKRLIGKLFMKEKVIILILSMLSCCIGYILLNYLFVNTVISGLIAFIIFVALILLFKIVKISDVRRYLVK